MTALSIVVPIYQCAATIGATLAALRAQSLQDIEIIVADDGSDDGGADVAEAQAGLDSRIRVLRLPHRGVSSARNAAVGEACGPLIGFCDGDDLWAPEKAERHVALHAGSPQIGLSYSGTVIVDADLRPTGIVQIPPAGDLTLFDLMCGNPVGNGSTPVVRRDCLDAVALRRGGSVQWFDETLDRSEDVELWCRISLAGWRLTAIPQLLTAYRVRSDGLSSDAEAQVDSWGRVMRRLASADTKAAKHERLATAYQWRWQARKSVNAGRGAEALERMLRCLLACPSIVGRDAKTVETVVAALALTCLGSVGRRLLRLLADRRRSRLPPISWLPD